MASTENGITSWKHIGLHGHSVGTFACTDAGIQWKSALYGRDDSAGTASTRSIPKAAISGAQWTVFGKSGHMRIQINKEQTSNSKLHHEMRFDGFPADDFDTIKDIFQEKYNVDLAKHNMSASGTQYGLSNITGKKLVFRHCVLDEADEEGEEFEVREGDEMMSLDLAEVSQCVLPGNNRNEVELQFPESDAVEANNDQLVSIRFYIPPDPEGDPSDRTVKSNAELLQQRIMQMANIRKTTGDVIVEFDLEKGSFLTPRGRYSIELYERFFRMRGQKYDYKIKYDDISRLFLLPKPDDVHMAFVIALDKPIRQGQQRYQYLVLQTNKDPDEVRVNLDEDTIKKEYGDDLQPIMRGSLSNLVAKTFKVIAKKKVFIPGKFSNANQQPCVKCALRANEGLLYPLEKQFVFIHKPPVLIRFNEVESVEFERYAGGQGSTRNFDLRVTLKASATSGAGQNEYTFSGIDRSDYTGLYDFLSKKSIRIKNLQETSAIETVAPVYNEDEIYGGPDDDMEEESEDEDYDEKAAAADQEQAGGSESEDSDMDDDDFGSEVDDNLDSDLEDARGGRNKKKENKSGDDSDDDDDDDDVIVDDHSSKKKKRKKSAAGGSPKGKKKAKKDPNAPKKALNAYMIYSQENRDRIKQENPDAKMGDIAKLLGEAYKKLGSEEKADLDKKVTKEKERYAREMKDYTPPEGFGGEEDGKKKKAKKDPNAPKGAKGAYTFFMQEYRDKIKDESPDLSFGEIGKALGEKWKVIGAEEKAKFEEMAKKDKERHKREMAEHKAKKEEDAGDDSDGVDDDDDDSDDE
ncbi:HMG high mobility group box-containing protein [Nitzschia inconspicua]|uniref:HMG high mobility group box-containing protein n=1 Tax=Nitzschia inconspicua TaxID=303405 RepID=A0A9K3PQE8_9STRA|nr:HMG high mobility group box-containing protein [Nitzschia inconspicua]